MMLIGRLHVCGFQAGLWFAMFWTVWRTVASRFVDWWEPAVKNIAANMITLNSYLVSSVDMLDYVTVAFWFRVRVCGKFSTFPALLSPLEPFLTTLGGYLVAGYIFQGTICFPKVVGRQLHRRCSKWTMDLWQQYRVGREPAHKTIDTCETAVSFMHVLS